MNNSFFYFKSKNKLLYLVTILGLFFFATHVFAQDAILRVLITGFEPFGGYQTNPSEQLVEFINSDRCEKFEGIKLKGITLPVTYFKSWDILYKEINKFHPDYILSFGYSPGSNRIKVESTAKNFDRGCRDNNDITHYGIIVDNGQTIYLNELPIKRIADALRNKKIPVSISSDAGGYLCNHIFYQERHFTNSKPDIRSGFFHIPNWPLHGERGIWSAIKEIIYVLKLYSIKVGIFEYEPIKDDVSLNIKQLNEIVLKTKNNGIRFYIFPEMALSGLIYKSPSDLLNSNKVYKGNYVTETLKSIVSENNIFLSLGLVTKHSEKLFNSYQIFTPTGLVYTYNKKHLYGSDFNWAKDGIDYPILNTRFGKIGALICHDVVYRESFITYLKNDVNILIIGTNWIGETPITKYLTNYLKRFSAIFISDRRGFENNIEFMGNTSVIDQNGIYTPIKIIDDIKGIIYLFISDKST